VSRVHAGFNQDNGTGRVQGIGPGPFPEGVDALTRYLKELPSSMTGRIRLSGTGGPATGGTDNAAFQCMKSPVYGLNAVGWDYGSTTWHTNRDTYDKLIAEDLQNNATLVAMLVYMADQDAKLLSHDVISLPNNNDGTPRAWPTCSTGDRNTAASPR
jgi:carboxypeptidase Q